MTGHYSFQNYKICRFHTNFARYSSTSNNTKMFIQAGEFLSEPFCSNIGTPQGDVISPLLFSLFLNDIEAWIPNLGPMLHGVRIGYLMYADDIVLLAENANDLQKMINALHTYCERNKLVINIGKTKCMIFHRGRCPKASFIYNNQELEIVNAFTYLGFKFTVQLSFTKHLEALIIKARSRIGQLYSRLPLMNIPIDLLLDAFRTYCTPIFLYGIPLWYNKCSNNSLRSLDALFTKFLKQYLHLPPWTNNATTYFITCTEPFSKQLASRAPHMISSFTYPDCFSGLKLSFLDRPSSNEPDLFDPIPNVPSEFWTSRVYASIPSDSFYRKTLLREIFDLNHMDLCKTEKFHEHHQISCICRFCGEHVHRYHDRYCSNANQ